MIVVLGCLRRLIGVVLILALVAGAAWFFRDRLRGWWNEARGIDPVEAPLPTEALAERAQQKLGEIAAGERTRVALSELEVQSLLGFRYGALLPAFVDSPRVEISGDRLGLRVRVPADRLPGVDELGEAAAFLPDTTDLYVGGAILPLDSGRVALAIDDVRAERIPLPHRLVPDALERLGRRDEPGLPADAIAVPLPPGAAAAYVRNDSLVLLSRPASNGTNDGD